MTLPSLGTLLELYQQKDNYPDIPNTGSYASTSYTNRDASYTCKGFSNGSNVGIRDYNQCSLMCIASK